MATYSPQSLGINANSTGGVFQQGAWYDGRQYWNGTLGEPGKIHPESNQQGAGKSVSKEVVSQTNPANVNYIQAQQLQAGVNPSYTTGANSSYVNSLNAEVEKARKALEATLKKQQEENEKKLAELRETEKKTVEQIGELTTPFREDLENAERERLYINKNFEENQKLIDELDTLLTEGNDLIRQQKEVTGLAAVRNPRIQKAMDDVAARAGVIEAVINARNGQIAQAYNMIDRSIGAISADRQDRLTYYQTILNLTNRDILMLDADSKKIAQEQIDLLKTDLTRAQATADYVKQLMVNPSTAALMGEAGVSLNDSVEVIQSKLALASYNKEIREMANQLTLSGATPVYDPSTVPSDQLVSFTDSKGQKHYFKTQAKAATSSDMVSDIITKLNPGSGGTKTNTAPVGGFPKASFKKGAKWRDPNTGLIWEHIGNGQWRLA